MLQPVVRRTWAPRVRRLLGRATLLRGGSVGPARPWGDRHDGLETPSYWRVPLQILLARTLVHMNYGHDVPLVSQPPISQLSTEGV